jgi:hypothetical protein
MKNKKKFNMKNIDYSSLTEITVRTQAELNSIPLDFKGSIVIDSGKSRWMIVENRYYRPVIVSKNSSVRVYKNSYVKTFDNSIIEAYDDSLVEAYENAFVVAWRNSSIVADGNSTVKAYEDSSVIAWENSSVSAWGRSSVVAYGNSSITAYGNSIIVTRGSSFVRAYMNSSVEAYMDSSVEAYGNSSVKAFEDSSVRAFRNSSVSAYDNASIKAYENSSIKAYGNVRVADYLQGAKIQTYNNARIVYNPKTIHEFLDFYNIKHNKKTAKFYKAVHKLENIYFSNYDNNFVYKIGKIVKEECDLNVEEDCSKGIHVATLNWALDHGESWDDLAILELEVDIDKIILPTYSYGKVRTSEAKVLREVPLEECGLFGKILAKKKVKK